MLRRKHLRGMSVTFSIDGRRTNAFYHYTRDDGAGNVTSGWGLYSHWDGDEDKAAWKDAVLAYCKENSIVLPGGKVKAAISEVRDRLASASAAELPARRPAVMPVLADLIAKMGEPGADPCDDGFMSELMETSEKMPTAREAARYSLDSAIYNSKIDLLAALSGMEGLGASAFAYPVLDALDALVDDFLSSADFAYDEYKALHSSILRLMERLADPDVSDELRYLYRTEIEGRMEGLSAEAKEMVFAIFSMDTFARITGMLKNLEGATEEMWRGAISSARTIADVDIGFGGILDSSTWQPDSALISGIKGAAAALVPLLAGMAGAMLAMRIMQKDDQAADSSTLAAVSAAEGAGLAEYDAQGGSLFVLAKESKGGYSLEYASEDASAGSAAAGGSAAFSLCDYEVPTDTAAAVAAGPFGETGLIAFEFGGDSYGISVQAGADVPAGGVIGSMQGRPVKSPAAFTVSEARGGVVIGRYADSSLPASVPTASTECDAIVGALSEMEKCVAYIRDYMSYARFPEFALHTREKAAVRGAAADVIELSTDDFVAEYEKEADAVIKSYKNGVKALCSKESVSAAAESDDVADLKDSLDSLKGKMVSDIGSLYASNPGSMKYCSRGDVKDYMLLSEYENYLYGGNFEYDADNGYVSRLFKSVSKFIGVRGRLEISADGAGTAALAEKFNEACESVLGEKWDAGKDGTYYSALSATVSAKSAVVASDGEESLSGAYSAALEYLKAKAGLTSSSQDGLLKSLKRIAIMFASILYAEMSAGSIESQNSADASDGYLKRLMAQTAAEAAELGGIAKDALDWYGANKGADAFASLAGTSLPFPTRIYKDGEACDYYYLPPDGGKAERPATQAELASPSSCKTAYRVDDYAYWLRYFSAATAAGCLLPAYWPTGMVVDGEPVRMPVVYVPVPTGYGGGRAKVSVLGGRIVMVAGVGICGVSAMPILLFANLSNVDGTVILPLEEVLGGMSESLKKAKAKSGTVVSDAVGDAISACDGEIRSATSDLRDAEYQIQKMEELLSEDKAARGVAAASGKDPNFGAA